MCDVLGMVAEIGAAPGEHHFFIEFLTQAPGVSIPDDLREDYPERMTIVLQHQFDDLIIDENRLSVTLWFKSKEARLVVPFDAVTSFADPSAQFGLRFEPAEASNSDEGITQSPKAENTDGDETETAPNDAQSDGADIVSLDAFRKK